MCSIIYWTASGRSFIHQGSEYGIRRLLAGELAGLRWQWLDKPTTNTVEAA